MTLIDHTALEQDINAQCAGAGKAARCANAAVPTLVSRHIAATYFPV